MGSGAIDNEVEAPAVVRGDVWGGRVSETAASCSTSSSGGAVRQVGRQRRTAHRAAWRQVCFAEPHSRSLSSGAQPQGAGRPERAGFGAARLERRRVTTKRSNGLQLCRRRRAIAATPATAA